MGILNFMNFALVDFDMDLFTKLSLSDILAAGISLAKTPHFAMP